MIRVLYITALLLVSLDARENPFFPAQGEKDIPYTTNQMRNVEPFKRLSITLPSSARVIKKVSIEYENLDATVETKSVDLENKIDWHLPIFISQSYEESRDSKEEFKEIASIEEAKFLESSKSLKIVTKDSILRDFLLVKPHRIVLDFKKDKSVKAYSKEIENSRFSKIRVGNHKGYYRIVVELDGLYRYSMKKEDDGYILKLR